MAKRTNNAAKTIGEICLYGGNAATGSKSGWLATIGPLTDGRMLGDGEPHYYGLTEAVWAACEALRESGIQRGNAWVFAPGGKLRALVDINHPAYYGQLQWEAAPVFTLSAAAIMEAAEAA